MTFSWTDQLSTGIAEIDVQHRTLIKQVNSLLDACGDQKGYDEVDRFLRFLAGYIKIHFGDEERLMAKHDYPKREEQHRAHEEFRIRIERLRDDYQNAALKEKAVEEACRSAAEWLINHIQTMDIEMAQYVRGRNS